MDAGGFSEDGDRDGGMEDYELCLRLVRDRGLFPVAAGVDERHVRPRDVDAVRAVGIQSARFPNDPRRLLKVVGHGGGLSRLTVP